MTENKDGPQRFHLTYDATVHPEGLLKGEIPIGRGACDALIITSIVLPTDGSYSQRVMAIDGATGLPLAGPALFKAWCVWTYGLAQQPDLPDSAREFLLDIHKIIGEGLRAPRRADEEAGLLRKINCPACGYE